MAIDDEDPIPSITKPLVFAYYITGHGFGHATRVVEVTRHLISAGHDVHVVTAAPEFVFTSEIQSSRLFIRKVVLDCGVVQSDALTVDPLASLQKYSEIAVIPRASILATEIEWLTSIKADLVVSDAVPIACRAAADAGIRSVCVTNFSWDFIYAEYVMAAGYHHRSIVWQVAEDYSHCEFVIRLPGYCPMPAFRDVIDAPLVVRRLHRSRSEVRRDLGVGEDVKLVILNFGGQLAHWKLKEDYLPSGWLCLVCGAPDDQELPSNFIRLEKDVYSPDVMGASDCMIGKLGYGTVSEALAYKLPFIFVRKDYFNEEPFLRHMIEYYQSGVEMIRRDFLTGQWAPYLLRAISLKPSYDGDTDGGKVAACILQDTAIGKSNASRKFSGANRLRDAIVLGYQLQRASGRDDIPEWYSIAETELGLHTTFPNVEMNGKSCPAKFTEDFEILHGDLRGLPDTMSFLRSLAELDDETEKLRTREIIAAAGIFNWEDEIFVARAPGRLDVMGGIADYSGSLVLQMPIREACHVAVQRTHPSKQKLWKHAQARKLAKAQQFSPVLEIVSYGSELSNRGPTFDMDLADFMDGEQLMSYEEANRFFAKDPSQKWAAYVAGTILVLMTELGVRFEDGISILVSSAVPEGKGVSSSAAVEVATMSAVAAAHGIHIMPRDLALLCQKVENCIVGAPCGIMDQMASACGEANKLLAMVCQPAEVIGLVNIPTHIRFWGIDSGIRHSIGGADYGSVRIGAYMGRKIIKCTASKLSSFSLSVANPPEQMDEKISDESEGEIGILKAEASLDYLCNILPHRYEAEYAKRLPDSIFGETFLKIYHDHDDPVTTIDKNRTYVIKAPASHPIYENYRVKAFKSLLSAESSHEQLTSLGELMYQCHHSYGACGLGSDGTDRLVKLVQEMQHIKLSKSENGTLFGAKITGGGSGGSVCVMGRNCLRSSEQILEIQQKYKAATGYLPFLFEGSSPGAAEFGYLKIRRRCPSTLS